MWAFVSGFVPYFLISGWLIFCDDLTSDPAFHVRVVSKRHSEHSTAMIANTLPFEWRSS